MRVSYAQIVPRRDSVMQRFVDDDAGYVAWLEAHPRGYVLNTFPHMSSSYLVLHRTTCGTVNRPLAKGREWTHLYGKACSDDHAELAVWALRETGKSVHGCGTCGPPVAPAVDVVIPAGASTAHAHGRRTPRADDREVQHDGEPVRIIIDRATTGAGRTGPPLVIEGAQWLAELVFRRDPSAVGAMSYDTWIEATQLDPERRARIIDEDITAVNRTTAARTSHEAWAPTITGNDWAWLAALDPDWDLLDLDSVVWHEAGVAARLRRVLDALLWTSSPGSNLFSSLDGWERVVRLRGPNDPVGQVCQRGEPDLGDRGLGSSRGIADDPPTVSGHRPS